jgi:transcriptional regulator with XRE-family HTH domain
MAKRPATQRRRRAVRAALPPSIPHSIGRQLLAFRQQRNLFQWDVAKRLAITQRDVSRIESGSRELLPEEAQRFRAAFGIDLDSVRVPGGSEDVEALLLDEDEFLRVQQDKVVADGNESPYTLWMLNPESLPMLESNRFTEIWANNLAQGFEYRTIWILDLTKPEDLRRFIARAQAVAREALKTQQEWSGGEIHLHPVVLPEAFKSAPTDIAKIRSYYGQLAAELRNDAGIGKVLRLHAPLSESESKPTTASPYAHLLQFLLRFYFDSACVVAYKPHSLLAKQHVAIELKDIARHDDPEPRRGFCFLGDAATARFMSNLEELALLLPKEIL